MCALSLEQAHGKEVCCFFARKGWCRYGSSCWYQHGTTKTASIELETKLNQLEEAVQNLQQEHNNKTAINKKTAIITGLITSFGKCMVLTRGCYASVERVSIVSLSPVALLTDL